LIQGTFKPSDKITIANVMETLSYMPSVLVSFLTTSTTMTRGFKRLRQISGDPTQGEWAKIESPDSGIAKFKALQFLLRQSAVKGLKASSRFFIA
jgi:hypothetical protein